VQCLGAGLKECVSTADLKEYSEHCTSQWHSCQSERFRLPTVCCNCRGRLVLLVQVVNKLYTLSHRKIRQNARVKPSARTLLQVLDLSPLQRHISRRQAAAASGGNRWRYNRLGLGMEVRVGVDGILNLLRGASSNLEDALK
jgi:hypothetical protein